MKIISYPIMRTKCDRCDCEFTFNYGDIRFKFLHCENDTHVICPICSRRIYLPQSFKEIREQYEQ